MAGKALELRDKRPYWGDGTPPKGSEIWHRSVYYMWFEYLRRNDGYRHYCETKEGPYEELYADFRNIHNGPFRSWFNFVGAPLFCEPYPEQVGEIDFLAELKSTGQLSDMFLEPHFFPFMSEKWSHEDFLDRIPNLVSDMWQAMNDALNNDRNFIYLKIPIHAERDLSLERIGKMINSAQRPYKRKRQSMPSKAKYPIHTKYDIDALILNLEAWDMKQAGAKSFEIHEAVFGKLSDEKLRSVIEKRGEGYDEKELVRKRVERYSSKVSKATKSAALMIENVGRGQFPCKDEI